MNAAPFLYGLALALVGCGSSDSKPASSEPPGKQLPAPSVYDCKATAAPERVSPISVSCATDRACKEKLVAGHRGAGGELGVLAPEDTLAAVRAAIAIGADFVETDPRATKDGVLINLHDATLDRTTDGTGNAEELTLSEIQTLHIEATGYDGDFSCERVPTIEDLLTLARGRIHVLLDANKTDRVDLLVQAVQTTNTLEWAIFDTDDANKIQEALSLEPKLLTMIRVDDAAELQTELAMFESHPPVIVEIDAGMDPASIVPAVHAAGHRAFVDVFGIDLAAKFSNDAQSYAAAFSSGVDITQTDRPELVLEYLGR